MTQDQTAYVLPDGSAFATASFPLPSNHWLTATGQNVPPMTLRLGIDHPQHRELCDRVTRAAKYAIRCATMNGSDNDFDPDALIQNLLVGLFGYHTPDGLTNDDWGNPSPIPCRIDTVKDMQ